MRASMPGPLVKANHPGLFDRVRRLPWREITLDHHDRNRAHHRLEIRRLKTAAFTHLDHPAAARLFKSSAGERTSPPAHSPSSASA